jgi:hypothetical protein
VSTDIVYFPARVVVSVTTTRIRGDGQVPAASDEIPEPMVITSLRARRRFHAAIIGHSLTLLNS